MSLKVHCEVPHIRLAEIKALATRSAVWTTLEIQGSFLTPFYPSVMNILREYKSLFRTGIHLNLQSEYRPSHMQRKDDLDQTAWLLVHYPGYDETIARLVVASWHC